MARILYQICIIYNIILPHRFAYSFDCEIFRTLERNIATPAIEPHQVGVSPRTIITHVATYHHQNAMLFQLYSKKCKQPVKTNVRAAAASFRDEAESQTFAVSELLLESYFIRLPLHCQIKLDPVIIAGPLAV